MHPDVTFRKRLLGFLILSLSAGLAAACSDKIDEPVPEDLFQEYGEGEGKDEPTSETKKEDKVSSKPKRVRAKLVKRASPLREKDFPLRFIREGHTEVLLGQQSVLEILAFTGPTQDFQDIPRMPRDIMKINKEVLHMAQRSSRDVRTRFFKDLEIFLVFKAGYDAMSHEARLDLVNRWKKRYGIEPPPEPEDADSPCAWLRTNPLFWKKGGRFWWWASHALMKEEGLKILEDGRVLIQLPEFDRPYTS